MRNGLWKELGCRVLKKYEEVNFTLFMSPFEAAEVAQFLLDHKFWDLAESITNQIKTIME